MFLPYSRAGEGNGDQDRGTLLGRTCKGCPRLFRKLHSGTLPFLFSQFYNGSCYFAAQLHTSLQHPDERLLEHAAELITQLDALGIRPSSAEEDEEVVDEGWEDVDESDEDVEMT